MKIAIQPRQASVGGFVATPRVRELVNEVLDSGILSFGEKTRRFEREFAALHDCTYGISSNSGTSSLQVAMQAMKEHHRWDSGDKVIVPATTFVATANIVTHNRLVPSFVDVDPFTFNIDETLIEENIKKDTRAIIPVHLFGQPCNMSTILAIAETYNLRIIEDSCETMFARHEDIPVGSWGDIGCFSTYVAHIIVTGVGGMSTTNSPHYAARMRSLVNHGLNIEQLNPDENFAPQPTPGRRFKFSSIGHSFRLTELEAAIGLAQLEVWEENMAVRKRNAGLLEAGVKAINEQYGNVMRTQRNIEGNHGEHAHMMFPIVLSEDADKEPMMAFLNKQGVETRDMLPLVNQPIYSWMPRIHYPVSRMLVERGFYVGCHSLLAPGDIQYIIQCLGDYYDERQRIRG